MSKNKLVYIVGAIILAVVSFDLHSQSLERLSFPQVVVSNGDVSATAGSSFGISLSGANGSLTITSEYGEGDFHNEIVLETGHIVLEGGISVYPNPAEYIVYLVFENPETFDTHKKVEIYDMGGRIVHSVQMSSFAEEVAIDVSHIPQGTYIIKVGSKSVKMIKG